MTSEEAKTLDTFARRGLEEASSLQDWMEKNGVNQTELARRAQMHKGQLSSLLKGSRRCSIATALRLAMVTGVPVENLTAWPKVPLKRIILEVASNEDGT